jgi:hypothetical protein
MVMEKIDITLKFSPEAKALYEDFFSIKIAHNEDYDLEGYYEGNGVSFSGMPKDDYEGIIEELNRSGIPSPYHPAIVGILHYMNWNYRNCQERFGDFNQQMEDWDSLGTFLSGCFYYELEPFEIVLKANTKTKEPFDARIKSPSVIHEILNTIMNDDKLVHIRPNDQIFKKEWITRKGRPDNTPLRSTAMSSVKAHQLMVKHGIVASRYQAEKLFAELFRVLGIIDKDNPYPYDLAKQYFKEYRQTNFLKYLRMRKSRKKNRWQM